MLQTHLQPKHLLLPVCIAERLLKTYLKMKSYGFFQDISHANDFRKDTDIPLLTLLRLQNEHPNGIFSCWGRQGTGLVLGIALQELSTGWDPQHHHLPALGVPQDS